MTIENRIAELTAAWEDAVNYGRDESEPPHRASDYALSEDDYRAGLSDDEAAEIVALIERQAENQKRAERIARRIARYTDAYEGSAEEVGHPEGQPLIETFDDLRALLTAAALAGMEES